MSSATFIMTYEEKCEFNSELLMFLKKKKNDDEARRILEKYKPNEFVSTAGGSKERLQWTLLHYAAHLGYDDVVKFLINWGFKVDAEDHLGNTPLVLASIANHEKVVEVLLKAKSDIHMITKCEGKSVLQIILERRIRSYEVNRILFKDMTLQTLIKIDFAKKLREANFSLSHIIDFDNVELLKLLLDQGHYTVDDRDRNDGKAALHTAVQRHNLLMVKVLLEYGADVDTLDKSKSTPLWYLFYFQANHSSDECLEILKLILRSATALTSCQSWGWMQIRNILVYGCREAVGLVLKSIDNLNVVDKMGNTVVHYMVINRNPDVIETLKYRDFNVNLRNHNGDTPLHLAAEKRMPGAITFFLEKGGLNFTGEALNRVFYSFKQLSNYATTRQWILLLLENYSDTFVNNIMENFNLVSQFHNQVLWSTKFEQGKELLALVKLIFAYLAMSKLQKVEIRDFVFSKIAVQPSWIEYFDMNVRQVNLMRETTIYGKVMLFDFFSESLKKLSAYLRNEELVVKLYEAMEDLEVSSPYSELLRNRLLKITKFAELRDKAIAIIDRIAGFEDGSFYIAAEYIVDYLKIEDMKKLICASIVIRSDVVVNGIGLYE